MFRAAVCFPVSSISLTSFLPDRITDFVLWSDPVWFHLCDLIFWSDLIFFLRSCHLYALFINSHECFYAVVRALSEKPLWNYRSCGLFWFRSSFFVFLFWCERTSYLLLWILSSCILILYLWIFFCFAFQEWITNVVSHPADWEIVTEDHLPEQVRRSVK